MRRLQRSSGADNRSSLSAPIMTEVECRASAAETATTTTMTTTTTANTTTMKSEEEKFGVPSKVPTLIELKKIIPDHCFKPDLKLSFYYTFKDLGISLGLWLVLIGLENQPFQMLYYVYLPVYWFFQSLMIAALFLVGHDCGHESFSNSTLINDVVGNVVHTLCLAPYYPWKLTHRNHHKNTANIDKDEQFYPIREKHVKEDPALQVPYKYVPLFGLGTAWFVYLFKGYSPRKVNHFNPWDPLLVPHFAQCLLSLAILGSWIMWGLVPYSNAFGFTKLAIHYLIPVFGFGVWIVTITFLHHHDDHVPWYADEKWDYVKGQLSTVDRHYGDPWHGLLHNIGTHQIHHLFTKVPHYRLEEATAAFRSHFPHLTRVSHENILGAFNRMFWIFADQSIIPDDANFHAYKTIKKDN